MEESEMQKTSEDESSRNESLDDSKRTDDQENSTVATGEGHNSCLDNLANNAENLVEKKEESTNLCQTIINLLKGNIGIGVLALPYAVKLAGSLLGPFIITLVGMIILYNMITLSVANRKLAKEKANKRLCLGLAGTLKYALKHHKYDRTAMIMTPALNVFLVIYLTGACALYVVAASEVFYEVSELFSIKIWTGILMVPVIILSFISRIYTVSILSGFSNFLCLLGLTIVLIYLIPSVKSPANYKFANQWQSVFACINTVVFAFEGMSTFIPITNSLIEEKQVPVALLVSNTITTLIYLLIGWLGYLSFGDVIKPQILLNLPITWYFNTMKIAYALGLVFSFAVIMYCVLTIVMPKLTKQFSLDTIYTFPVEVVLRLLLIGLGVALAVLVPIFSDLLGLLGSFFSIPISFILPPVIDLLTSETPEPGSAKLWKFKRVLNCCIMVLGCGLTGLGIYSSVSDLMRKFK